MIIFLFIGQIFNSVFIIILGFYFAFIAFMFDTSLSSSFWFYAGAGLATVVFGPVFFLFREMRKNPGDDSERVKLNWHNLRAIWKETKAQEKEDALEKEKQAEIAVAYSKERIEKLRSLAEQSQSQEPKSSGNPH